MEIAYCKGYVIQLVLPASVAFGVSYQFKLLHCECVLTWSVFPTQDCLWVEGRYQPPHVMPSLLISVNSHTFARCPPGLYDCMHTYRCFYTLLHFKCTHVKNPRSQFRAATIRGSVFWIRARQGGGEISFCEGAVFPSRPFVCLSFQISCVLCQLVTICLASKLLAAR